MSPEKTDPKARPEKTDPNHNTEKTNPNRNTRHPKKPTRKTEGYPGHTRDPTTKLGQNPKNHSSGVIFGFWFPFFWLGWGFLFGWDGLCFEDVSIPIVLFVLFVPWPASHGL